MVKGNTDRSDLSYRIMKMLMANEQNSTGKDAMLASFYIAEKFGVRHQDVVYLMKHHSDIGRVSMQPIKEAGSTKKDVGYRFGITSMGWRWVSDQRKKRGE